MVYFDVVKELISSLTLEEENMKKAAEIISNTIISNGIVYSFGSGHSHSIALEIGLRAGGLVPVVTIEEPSKGQYEKIEGIGNEFLRKFDIRENDCFILISNSGRNPLTIDMALEIKKMGLPIIVLTALDFSKTQTSRHSSGKKLYELADVILDNKGVEGDSCVEIKGLDGKIGPTSTVSGCLLLNQTICYAVEDMISKNHIPPVLLSANIDSGKEHNDIALKKYKDRLHVNIVI